ncbi:CBO0543 family protein [Paenibacillus thailandensis]|uniref:CBO0543 family protein n=1 Tax=Paenibacillus thailandensis TaxID=393250 RepID=A0ABW5QWC4_9BACL
MTLELWILLSVYVVAIGAFCFIPKNKIRLAVLAFLTKHVITFLIGLVVVEFGLIEYPVRLFPSVNRTSFTYEAFALPAVCSFFMIWYPIDRSKLYQLGYYAAYCSVLTGFELVLETYTDLIEYIHWEWYVTWISLCISFYITRRLCVWFFSKA